MMTKRFRFLASPAVVVATIALTVQGLYLLDCRDDPTFDTPIIDAADYHAAATRFAEGQPLAQGAFWQPPLFPFLLGLVYRIAGPDVVTARVALALVAVGSCLLAWRIATRLFDPITGVVAGIMLALCGPFLFFSTRLLPVGLAVFLDLLALVCWIRCLDTGRLRHWLLLGLVAGLATITVPNAAVLPVVAVTGIIVQRLRGKSGPAWLKPTGAVLLGFAAAVAPITIHNRAVSGEWVVISTNGGINFFIGNNPHREQTLAVRPGEAWRRLARDHAADASRSRARQSAHLVRETLRYAAGQPADFAAGLGIKALRLANAREIPRNVDAYIARDHSTLLSLLLWRAGPLAFPFGLLAPLSAVGVLVLGYSFIEGLRSGWHGQTCLPVLSPAPIAGKLVPAQDTHQRTSHGVPASGAMPKPGAAGRRHAFSRHGTASLAHDARCLALLGFIVAYGLSIVLFFVSSRYRLPLAAAMCPLAAAGLVAIVRLARGRRAAGPGPLATGAMLAIVAVIVHWPIRTPTDGVDFRAERSLCVGAARLTDGKPDQAEPFLRDALNRTPRYTDAAVKLAAVLARRGDVDEAESLLRRAVTWDSQSAETAVALGGLLLQQDRLDEAEHAFRQALATDSTSPNAHTGLADTLLRLNRTAEAIDHYRTALTWTNHLGPILLRLADALVEEQAFEEAIERYRQALLNTDPDPATLNRIAWLLATCPSAELRDCHRAIEIAQHVVSLTSPHRPGPLDTLAAAYAECGRWDDAVAAAGRALDLALAENDVAAAGAIRRRLRLYRSYERLSQNPLPRRPASPKPD